MKQGKGFTLIELTIALGVMAVALSIVVVRFSWGGARQQTINAARQLGNTTITYREKAQLDECVYAIKIDADAGQYTITQPSERSLSAVNAAVPVATVKLEDGVKIAAITVQSRPVASPCVLFFDPRGIVPDASIEMDHTQGPKVVVQLLPLVDGVDYNELQAP